MCIYLREYLRGMAGVRAGLSACMPSMKSMSPASSLHLFPSKRLCPSLKSNLGISTSSPRRSAESCSFRKATHHSLSHHRSQIRVLAVCLLSTSPARVAEYVYIGSPHRKAVESCSGNAVLILLVPLGAGLVTRHREHLLNKRHIKRCRHADWFGEDCDIAAGCRNTNQHRTVGG